MGAQTVFNCLANYNSDQLRDILKLYSYSEGAVIKQLKSYPGRSEYHGHGSGNANDNSGEHAGAADSRANAIRYLRDNAPEQTVQESVSNRPTRSSMRQVGPAEMAETIATEEGGNLGKMQVRYIDEFGADWQKNKKVLAVYNRFKAVKRANNSSAKNKKR